MKFFSLIYQGEIHPAEDEKVIPAEEFSTLMQASEILERAKEDAEQFKKENRRRWAAAERKSPKKRALMRAFKNSMST